MTPEEARICDMFVHMLEDFGELADRDLTAADINDILTLSKGVLGISEPGRDRYERALHRSAQVTLDLHNWLDDEAERNEWISARDELLRIRNDKDG